MTSILLIGFFLTLPVVADTDGKEAAHAIYISVVEIDHRDPSKQTQVKIKVFTDDLENALRNTFGHPFQLPDAQACLKEKQAIDDYFQQHFKLEVDGKKTVLSFQKGERNNDATWLYFDLSWSETVARSIDHRRLLYGVVPHTNYHFDSSMKVMPFGLRNLLQTRWPVELIFDQLSVFFIANCSGLHVTGYVFF